MTDSSLYDERPETWQITKPLKRHVEVLPEFVGWDVKTCHEEMLAERAALRDRPSETTEAE